jgi:outer membrane protein assembly factor BamD (BamD/ComL family)
MDTDAKERWRLEGYLPKTEFRAQLELGLARVDFMHKRWSDAEQRYSRIAERYADTAAAPEAIYWRGVTHYKGTNDHKVLKPVADELTTKYSNNIWTLKASVWL